MPTAKGNLGTCPLPRIIPESPLSATEGQQLLAALLFLRWVDYEEAEREAMALFEDAAYEPMLPEPLHWRRWHRLPPDELGEFLLRRLIPALERPDGPGFHPAFAHLPLFADKLTRAAGLPVSMLLALLEWIAALPFETRRDHQRALAAFDDACGKTMSKDAAQYRTPPEIARLMAAIARPAPGETVYDPCFGQGETLLAASRFLSVQREGTIDAHDLRTDVPRPVPRGLGVLGMELSAHAFRVGLVRLLLAGVESPRLQQGNALERSPLIEDLPGGIDLAMVDPPLGARTSLAWFERYPVTSKDVAVLMVQHAMQQLGADGHAVILVPNGLLFNKIHQPFRQWLLERHRVEAIAALPPGALISTGIQVSILLVAAKGPTQTVRMVDANAIEEASPRGKPSALSADSVDAIASAIRSSSAQDNAWDVAVTEIAAADWDLTPRRRRETELDRSLADLQALVDVRPPRRVRRHRSGTKRSQPRASA